MEIREELVENVEGGSVTKLNKIKERDSLQFNCQDLEQEQKVDVNPKQQNSQNIHIYLNTDRNNYSARITGTTYIEKNKNTVAGTKICLYFGADKKSPVYKTNSDNNGNFSIENIPPGYYTIVAQSGNMEYRSHYIKVLPCQDVHESVLLKELR